MLSSLLGTFVGALAADRLGYTVPFVVSAFLIACSIPFAHFLLREPRIGKLRSVRGSVMSSFKELLPNASKFVRNRQISILMLGIICHSFAMNLTFPFTGLYAKNVLGYVLTSVGGLLSFRQLGGLMGQIPSGKIVDRFGGELGYFLHVFSTAPIVYLFVISRSYYATLIVLMCWGLFMGLDMASVRTVIVKFAEDGGTGAALGTIQSIQGVVGLASPIIRGWLWSNVSPKSPFIVATVMNLIGSLPLALLMLRKRKKTAFIKG